MREKAGARTGAPDASVHGSWASVPRGTARGGRAGSRDAAELTRSRVACTRLPGPSHLLQPAREGPEQRGAAPVARGGINVELPAENGPGPKERRNEGPVRARERGHRCIRLTRGRASVPGGTARGGAP